MIYSSQHNLLDPSCRQLGGFDDEGLVSSGDVNTLFYERNLFLLWETEIETEV